LPNPSHAQALLHSLDLLGFLVHGDELPFQPLRHELGPGNTLFSSASQNGRTVPIRSLGGARHQVRRFLWFFGRVWTEAVLPPLKGCVGPE
jgi:hypothetical protein